MKRIVLVAVLLFGSGVTYAQNDALSQPSTPTLGERVAIYLQNMMTIKTAIWEVNHPTDMDYREEVHLAVTYEPSEKLIGVSVIGNQGDSKYVQALLEKIQRTLLSMGKKINHDYGIELKENDLSLAYLNTKTGKIVLRLKEGKVISEESAKTPEPETSPTPVSEPIKTP